MFDDFRQQAEESDFDQPATAANTSGNAPGIAQRYFLGMTPVQRFIISVELLFTVCLVGALVLMVLERIIPPFLY